MYADELLKPWYDGLRAEFPPFGIFDCHSHVGQNDPSGFSATVEQLLESLELAEARAAVFPLKEPDGYAEANLTAARLAERSDGRLVAFARLDPADDPARRAHDALGAGACGLKLHLSGEEFSLDDPRLAPVFRLADERRLPVMVHAGPEEDSVGPDALAVVERHPGLRMILAHCALPDLAWLWREAPAHPNLFFDTSWWGATHVLMLLALVPPGQVLSGGDLPYCTPLSGAMTTLRCAAQLGLSSEQIASILGGQFERLVKGDDPRDMGPAPGDLGARVDVILERVFVTLMSAQEALQRGEDASQQLRIARQACRVPDDHQDAGVLEPVSALLELYDERAESLEQQNQYAPGWDLIQAAAVIARTPAVPVGDVVAAEART